MDLAKSPLVPPHLAARYEAEAGHFWDLFYRRNRDRFFKDRHWFEAEFPQLLTAGRVLEVGCGAGNTAFPLLELNPGATVYACDFAPAAIELVRAHPAHAAAAAAGRLHAFVADITVDDLTANVPAGSIDVATMVFVLSAIAPEAMPRALRRVARTLRPGGQLLFRDYAAGDLAQERLAGEGRQQQLGPNFFVRWDGTCAYYFEEDFLRSLFESEGFRCEYVRQDRREQENRKRGLRMSRQFVQALFTYTGTSCNGSSGGVAASSGSGSVSEAGCDGLHAGCPPAREQQPAPQAQQEVQLQELCMQLGSTKLQICCTLPQQGCAAAAAAAAANQAASKALAGLVLQCPAVFHNTDVLELCAWDAPLAALAALRWCRQAVAAGSSEAATVLLRQNVRRNGHRFVIERLRLQTLAWQAPKDHGGGQQQQRQQWQQAQLAKAFPAGFHAVLAAVPAGASAADVAQLLATAAALVSQRPNALLLLCSSDPYLLEQAAAAAAQMNDLREAAQTEIAVAAAATSAACAVRFLCFQRCL